MVEINSSPLLVGNLQDGSTVDDSIKDSSLLACRICSKNGIVRLCGGPHIPSMLSIYVPVGTCTVPFPRFLLRFTKLSPWLSLIWSTQFVSLAQRSELWRFGTTELCCLLECLETDSILSNKCALLSSTNNFILIRHLWLLPPLRLMPCNKNAKN